MRPTVVVCHGAEARDWGFLPELADRLARAGFAVVSFDATDSAAAQGHALDAVLHALHAGSFGATPAAYGLLGHGLGGTWRCCAAPPTSGCARW